MNNLDYENTFIRIARDIILQKAGQYEAPAYWLNRAKIAESMKEELDKDLRKAHAQCVHFQLLNIELPDTYENSIVETQVEVQKKKTKQFEQQAEMIRQEISILRSKTTQQTNAINAEAQADSYEIRQKAVAEGIQGVLAAESEAYKDFSSQTGIGGKDISKYLFYNAVAGQKNSKLLVGVKNNIVNT